MPTNPHKLNKTFRRIIMELLLKIKNSQCRATEFAKLGISRAKVVPLSIAPSS
jgi:hypothetical protein